MRGKRARLTSNVVKIVTRVLYRLRCPQPRAFVRIRRKVDRDPRRGVNIVVHDALQQNPDLEFLKVRSQLPKAIDGRINRQAIVRGRQVRVPAREQIRTDDNIRRATNREQAVVRIEQALVVVIYPAAFPDNLPPARRTHEQRRACLLELLLGRVESDAGGHVREELRHVGCVVRGSEEGAEGRARLGERGVVDRELQHGPELVE